MAPCAYRMSVATARIISVLRTVTARRPRVGNILFHPKLRVSTSQVLSLRERAKPFAVGVGAVVIGL